MRDFKFILSKIFKKQFILLALVTMLTTLFVVNIVNRSNVRASEQLASVKCDVFVVEGKTANLIATDVYIVSDLDVSEIGFGDVNVKLEKNSKLEFVYSIENITNKECVFGLELRDENIQNFKIEYYIDDNFVGDLTKFDYVLATSEFVEIRVVVYVENLCSDANVVGALELSF